MKKPEKLVVTITRTPIDHGVSIESNCDGNLTPEMAGHLYDIIINNAVSIKYQSGMRKITKILNVPTMNILPLIISNLIFIIICMLAHV